MLNKAIISPARTSIFAEESNGYRSKRRVFYSNSKSKPDVICISIYREKFIYFPLGFIFSSIKYIVYGLFGLNAADFHNLKNSSTSLIKLDDGILFRLLHLYPFLPSELNTPFLCRLDSGFTPFQYKTAVILSQTCEYLHSKSADSRRSIEIVLKGNKFDTTALQIHPALLSVSS